MYTNFLHFVTQRNFQFLINATTFIVSVVTINKTTHQPINQPTIQKFKLFLSHYFRERNYVIIAIFLCYTAVRSKVNMRTAVLYYV